MNSIFLSMQVIVSFILQGKLCGDCTGWEECLEHVLDILNLEVFLSRETKMISEHVSGL